MLRLTANDLLKLGQLYLDEGRFADKQVLPATWAEKATAPHARVNRHTSYGYFWWGFELAHSAGYAALGYGGQLIAVLPEDNLVIVATSDMATTKHPFLVDSADLATELVAIVRKSALVE